MTVKLLKILYKCFLESMTYKLILKTAHVFKESTLFKYLIKTLDEEYVYKSMSYKFIKEITSKLGKFFQGPLKSCAVSINNSRAVNLINSVLFIVYTMLSMFVVVKIIEAVKGGAGLNDVIVIVLLVLSMVLILFINRFRWIVENSKFVNLAVCLFNKFMNEI